MDTRQYFRARGVAVTFPETSLVRCLVGSRPCYRCRLRRPDRSRPDRCRRHGSTNAKEADTAVQKTFDSKYFFVSRYVHVFRKRCDVFCRKYRLAGCIFRDGSPGNASAFASLLIIPLYVLAPVAFKPFYLRASGHL